ncbi:hypothetical protein [Streptomyces tauricus]|nr:hypothetical protein [Streptomyces tauricus]MCW8099633.1 hypothetical protein [Streptomyces tauricus]
MTAVAPHAGYPPRMLAIVYSSYDTATTVWAFVIALLIILTATWYARRRR